MKAIENAKPSVCPVCKGTIHPSAHGFGCPWGGK
jgi:hypothetical protein